MKNQDKKQTIRVLRPWVKVALLLILGAFLGIATLQLFTVKTVSKTPYGLYTCKGGIVKTCSASKQVAEYLGV